MKKDLKQIIDSILSSRAREEDVRLFDQFIYRKQWEEREVSAEVGTQIWARIDQQIRRTNRVRKIKQQRTFLAIAASIFLIAGLGLGIFLGLSDDPNPVYLTKSTTRGEQLAVHLADGSVVHLNAESKLTFPAEFSEGTRRMTLEGEAFFEVVRDAEKPFIVQSGVLTTAVLGTSFNVKAYPEQEHAFVTVATGKVKVSVSPSGGGDTTVDQVILIPGDQAQYAPQGKRLATVRVNVDTYLGWKDGVIRFENLPLRTAFDDLERWFDVEIESDQVEISDCVVTGTYHTQDLNKILESLSFINQLVYQRRGRNIIITNAQCL